MRKDAFIESLAKDLKQSPRKRSGSLLLLSMLVLSLLTGGLLILFIGLRSDLAQVIKRGGYQHEGMLLVIASVTAYGLTVRSTIPGVWRQPKLGFGLLLSALIIFIGMLSQHPDQNLPSLFIKYHCLLLILADGLLPLIFALSIVKKRAPTRPRLTLALALLGSFAAAVAVQQVICPIDDPWHLLLWHASILPISLGLAWGWGRRLLSW